MLQIQMFDIENKTTISLENMDLMPQKISFRDIVPEITDTSYLTHSIYYYPAKFIPQVVRFCIDEFTQKDDTIIDPFAGSGTVGLEALITERNAVLIDLNYLLEVVAPIKFYKEDELIDKNILYKKIEQIKSETEHFIPDFSNIKYWYPEILFEVISKYWAGVHKLENDIYKWIIQASLVRISKLFSWSEHRAPKLFKSKFKKKYIEDLLKNNWRKELDNRFIRLSYKYFDAVRNLQSKVKGFSNTIEYYAGIDSSTYKLNKKFDALITSPPYLQAQEYIRTSKLDLYWLGYSEEQIKSISKLEIPYRKANRIIETPYLNKIRYQLKNKKLINVLNSYFDHTIASLENNMNLLKSGSKACIFVGNPKIDGNEIDIWRIFTEYFTKNGFKFEIVFDDEIKTRQLFGQRNNKNPNGMKSEYLLILSKE